jgi:ribosomal protein L40E
VPEEIKGIEHLIKKVDDIQAKIDALEDRQLSSKLEILEFRDELKAIRAGARPGMPATPEGLEAELNEIRSAISKIQSMHEKLVTTEEIERLKRRIDEISEEIKHLKKKPKNVCSKCGAVSAPDAKFCDSCGSKLG